MVYKRECPNCGCELNYNSRSNWQKAIKKKQICRQCTYLNRKIAYKGENNPFFGKKHKPETIAKMQLREHPHVKEEWFRRLRSEQCKGEKNPIYGTSNYEIWLKKFGKEKADELKEQCRDKKSKASSGSNNPMYGKPSPQGSGNGWSGWYKGWFFRSLRELSYVINVIEANGLEWSSAEKKELRISYVDFAGHLRTYSADFLVAGKKLIEVKPVKLFSSPTVRIKQEAAIDFCIQNGLTYEIVDSPMLSDAEITKLYVDGTIQFTERYEKKFLERNPHVKVADFGGANSVGQEFLLQKCGETRHYLYER